jgi:sugar/nucleoside kinase (ribokinase family)
MDIAVVGDLNVDLVLTGLAELPAYRELRQAKGMRFALGGSSAIFACNAARLGASVGFVGKVGDDEFGAFLRRCLVAAGVDVSRLVADPSGATGICISMSFPDDYAMVSYPGIRRSFRLDDVDLDYVRSARHLHVSGYYLLPALQPGAPELFRRAKQAGLTTSLDPDHDSSGCWDGGIRDVLPSVDFFFPNEHEALHIARWGRPPGLPKAAGDGSPDRAAAADHLRSFAATTVIKLGSDGALAVIPEGTLSAPPFPVTPVDTTGAGDSFNAGFLFQYLRGAPLAECLRWGNACGALSTLALGGTEGFPTPGEVERFLRSR